MNLLTFSRAGWIVLLLELGFIFYYEYLRNKKINPALCLSKYWINKEKLFLIIIPVLIILLLLSIFMYILITSPVTESSNRNRLELIRITKESFSRHPWIGQGVGTFQKIVSYDYTYILDFGAPIDAHGFVQKILAEMGILGLISFLLILFFVFRKIYLAWRKEKNNYIIFGFLVSLIGLFGFQLFNTSYYVAKLWLIVGLALSASEACLLRYERK